MKNKTYTIRMDQKIFHMLDMLARSNNTTKSRIVHSCIKKALEEDEGSAEIFNETWDDDEGKRINKLASYDKNLLTYEEEKNLKVKK